MKSDDDSPPTVVAPAVAAPAKVVAPVATVEAKEEDDDDDDQEEEVIKKPTKRRAPPVKIAAPVEKGRGRAAKKESSDEEFEDGESEGEGSESEGEIIPEDPLGAAKIAFRAQHVIDVATIKRLIEEFKSEAELTEKYMHKYFDEIPLEEEDKPNAQQKKAYWAVPVVKHGDQISYTYSRGAPAAKPLNSK